MNKQIILGTPPSKSNSYKIVNMWDNKRKKYHASLAKSPALIQYEKDFFIQCNEYRNLMIDSYFEIELNVFYPSGRSDLDNSLKVILDCLQAVKAIKNDNKCTKIIANKFTDKLRPRIEFTINLAMKETNAA